MQRWQYQQRINLPLFAKVKLTELRIRQWYEHWNGQVYVSFSGGKDSTVLLHLARKLYPNLPALFIDSGVEYPEVRSFVKRFDNITWVRPKMTFEKVVNYWGWPLISKQVSHYIYGCYKKPGFNNKRHCRRVLTGKMSDGRTSKFRIPEKWKWLLDAPFKVSAHCCDELKKKPAMKYEKETVRRVILGFLSEESAMRKFEYIRTGCNVLAKKRPYSIPMSFWTEQDVLRFILENNLPIAKVYGDIIQQADGKLITTGYARTGCMYCGFGAHLEKEPTRFQKMRTTHPPHWKYCIERLGMGAVLSAIGVPFE